MAKRAINRPELQAAVDRLAAAIRSGEVKPSVADEELRALRRICKTYGIPIPRDMRAPRRRRR